MTGASLLTRTTGLEETMSKTKQTKRESGLNAIFHEVAQTGKLGERSMRAMVENRISYQAAREQAAKAMRHRATCTNPDCTCRQDQEPNR